MRVTVRFSVGCFLFFLFFHVAAAATIAHTHGTNFGNGNHLVLDAYLSKVAFPLFLAFPYTLDFLQRNRLPPWPVFVTIVAAISPRFCQLLAFITTIVFTDCRLLLSDIICRLFEILHRSLRRWSKQSNLIRDLQRELDALDDPAHVQQLRDDNHMFEMQVKAFKSNQIESNGLIKNLQDACSLKEQRIRHLVDDIKDLQHGHSPAAARATDRKLWSEMRKTYQQIAKLEEEKADVEETLNRVKLRLSKEQWGAGQRSNLERKHKAELREKQDEIDRQARLIAKLKGRSIFEQPQHVVTISHFVSAAAERLTYTSSEHREAIACFLEVTLKGCGMDPQQYGVWLPWTDAVPESHGTLSPQIPFNEDITPSHFVQYIPLKSNTMHQPPRSNLPGVVGAIEGHKWDTEGNPERCTVAEPEPKSTPQPSLPDFTQFVPPRLDQGPSLSKSVPVFGSTSALGEPPAFGIISGRNSTKPADSESSALPSPSKPSSTAVSGVGNGALNSLSFLAPALAPAVTPASSAGKSVRSLASSTCSQAASLNFDRSTWWQNAVA